MTFLHLKPTVLSIALAAFAGLLGPAGQASACDMAKGGRCDAIKVCGCCEASDRPERIAPASATAAVAPTPVPRTATRAPSPTGDCTCDEDRPSSPEPRPSQGPSEPRSGAPRDLGAPAYEWPASSASPARTNAPTAGSPLRTPLYLRNSRLLI